MRLIPAILLAIAALPAVADAATVHTQKPCSVNQLGYCSTFSDSNTIPIVRSYAFNMPAAGKALVQFNGTMECFDYAPGQAVLKLSSQIVISSSAAADYRKPGGGRHTAVIDHFGNSTSSAVTFNLASSRSISYASGGTKKVHFKIERIQHEKGWTCFVTAAAFTVTTRH